MLTKQQSYELRQLLIQIVEARTLAFKQGRGKPDWSEVEKRMPFEDVCRTALVLNIETDSLKIWWQIEKPSLMDRLVSFDERISEGLEGDQDD